MKKILSLAVVLALVLMVISGCAKPVEQLEEPEETPVKKAPEKIVKPAPVVEEEVEVKAEPEPEPAKVPTKAIQTLLGKHNGRVSNIRYMYQDATMKPEEWETWVKGDKMHVKLREMDNVRGDVYVSDIYLDLSSKTAVGYCEQSVYRCADPNSPVEVNFNKYYRKTPIDWIESVTYAEKDSEEQMQQRTVWKIKYAEGSKTTTMWVDDYYGIPLKVRVVDGGNTNDYVFEDLAFDLIDDSKLEHKFISKTYR